MQAVRYSVQFRHLHYIDAGRAGNLFIIEGEELPEVMKTGNIEMVKHNIGHEVFTFFLWYNYFKAFIKVR